MEVRVVIAEPVGSSFQDLLDGGGVDGGLEGRERAKVLC
jgi:hypothetical protein